MRQADCIVGLVAVIALSFALLAWARAPWAGSDGWANGHWQLRCPPGHGIRTTVGPEGTVMECQP